MLGGDCRAGPLASPRPVGHPCVERRRDEGNSSNFRGTTSIAIKLKGADADFGGGGGRGDGLVHRGLGGDRGIPNPATDPRVAAGPAGAAGDIHRIGGGSVENLRLKPAEAKLDTPGISVLKGGTPADAARQMKAAFPNATKLHEVAEVVGSTTERAIRDAGFGIMPDPTRKFPNHHRIIHPEGVAGFDDENLARLSRAFIEIGPGE